MVMKERIFTPRNARFTIDFAHLPGKGYALVDAENTFEETIQRKLKK